MIRFNKFFKRWQRWIKTQRKGSFAKSNLITLITKPVWQHERLSVLVGTPLVAAVIAGSASQVPSTDSLQSWDISQPTAEIFTAQTTISTPESFILPVASLTGISQFFHAGHPGLDFRAPKGSDVVAMESGVVKSIIESKTGYGRHIYMVNETGREALYAHLGLIMVETGEKVNAGTKIAEVGMTGWTTGPHLHFEVVDNGKKSNPLNYLSNAITAYAQASKVASK